MEIVGSQVQNRIKIHHRMYVHFLKPLADVSFALLLLILISPLMLAIALFIKMDSEGPVIFKQKRIGKSGREFSIYKLRTMYIHVPKEGRSPTDSRDPRITKIGRILRKTSLDEIPQLFNILRGEMSFIGPRPEQKSIVEACYTDFEKRRFLVKPGITGLWQISMDRSKPIHENIQHDFFYINNVSFLMDLKIIFNTIRVMVKSNTV